MCHTILRPKKGTNECFIKKGLPCIAVLLFGFTVISIEALTATCTAASEEDGHAHVSAYAYIETPSEVPF